jgi:plastocyanin
MWRWKRCGTRWAALVVALGVVAALAGAPAAAAQGTGPTTWHVQVGGQTPDMGIQGMGYYPGTITIDVGDTVTWTIASAEPHTITFLSGAQPLAPTSPQALAPAGGSTYDGTGFVSSGLLFQGKTYSLTFTKPGTYTYVCTIHPGMQGTVVVQPAGTPYPHDQAWYDAEGQQQLQSDLETGRQAEAGFQVTTAPGPDGTTIYRVAAGVGTMQASVARFLPGTLTVRVGDQVVWTTRCSSRTP